MSKMKNTGKNKGRLSEIYSYQETNTEERGSE